MNMREWFEERGQGTEPMAQYVERLATNLAQNRATLAWLERRLDWFMNPDEWPSGRIPQSVEIAFDCPGHRQKPMQYIEIHGLMMACILEVILGTARDHVREEEAAFKQAILDAAHPNGEV